jgi:hypothetical protein
MTANRSYDTEGLDSPTESWMQRHVRVKSHPEWGTGRVMRWYPAAGGNPPRLRVMMRHVAAPQVVPVSDIEVVD